MAGIGMFKVAPVLTAFALAAGASGGDEPELEPGLEPLTVVTDTGRHSFQVEIADDNAERERGLMFRPPLADDRGMLFQFPDSQERSFWMRNTPSSLDIIYIGADGRIVSIARNTTPYSETSIPSNGPATGVLELRGGRAAEISADPGDQVIHPFFQSR